jgi:hypothetical protein
LAEFALRVPNQIVANSVRRYQCRLFGAGFKLLDAFNGSGTASHRGDPKVSSQPITGVRFSEVLATKLTVDHRLPMTGVEQADRNWLLPLLA